MTKNITASVFANHAYIGSAELSPIDPTAGVYGGPFTPDLGYAAIEPTIRKVVTCALDQSADPAVVQAAFRERDQLKLEVRCHSGFVFHPGVVHIQDLTRWYPTQARELHMLGVPWQEAEAVFGH